MFLTIPREEAPASVLPEFSRNHATVGETMVNDKNTVVLKAESIENKRRISPTVFRYILSETLFSFFICFLFFFFIFFVNQILLMAREVLTRHVPFNQVALLILFSLPTVIALSAPFAVLVGTLMTVGRLTSDNEILVMLSSGLSYKNVFLPAITVGILISILSFFTNDVLLPAGTIQFNRLWRRILISTPALELESNSVKRFRDTVLVTGNVSGLRIDNIIILDRTSDGERRMIIANNAELKDGGDEGLSLEMSDAFLISSREIVREDYDYAYIGFLQYWVSNEDIIQAVVSISPREMSSRDVHSAITRINDELSIRVNDRKNRVVTQAYALENILRAGPQGEGWMRRAAVAGTFMRENQTLINIQNDRSLRIHRIEFNNKFALPSGAFFFVFLAVSIGLMVKKNGQAVGLICGVGLSLIYWVMLFYGQTMALRLGTSPFWSMWFANIVCFVIGVLLALKRIRK